MAGEHGTMELETSRPHNGAVVEGMSVDNNEPPPGSGVREDIEAAMKELGEGAA